MPPPGSAPAPPAVLVVDDEAALLSLYSRVLPAHGFGVLAAATGAEAVRALRSRPTGVAAAVIDLNLPDACGLAVMDALRRLRPDLPCCITSGDLENDRGTLAAIEADAVLPKPFTFAELADVLRGLAAPAAGAAGRG